MVDAVAGRAAVLVDGGIRRGVDVAIALALGADAVLVGRPALWGLAAGGEAGALRVLELLRAELELTLRSAAARRRPSSAEPTCSAHGPQTYIRSVPSWPADPQRRIAEPRPRRRRPVLRGLRNVGSSIYYALGVTAAFALGLTPIAFVISGLIFAATAATYAEATVMYPEAGGSSSFARHAFNELVSFIAAWGQMLNYTITVAISAYFVPHYLAVSGSPSGTAPATSSRARC